MNSSLAVTDLTPQDTKNLLQTIYRVYALKDPETFGWDSLALMEQLVESEAAAVIKQSINPDTDAPIQSIDPNFEKLLSVDLCDLLGKLATASTGPFAQNMSRLAQGGPYKFSDFVTREALFAQDGFAEFIAVVPYDDHMILLVFGEALAQDPVAYYYLYRHWGTWTDRDRLLLNLLQPHLTQAYRNVMHCQRQQITIDQLQQSLDQTGTIVLNAAGQQQSITTQARDWLRSYFPGVQSPRRLPELLQAWVQNQVSQLQRTEPEPALLPLRIQQGDRQLTIRFTIDPANQTANQPYRLLLGEEQLLSPLTALTALGLSRREADVMVGVIQGQANPAIAQTLNISISTVRKHIENIYRKLEVQSRSEAIALVIQKLGGLNGSALGDRP
jgi:DNA-binding NarL/FixJ family response regulator